MARRTTPAATAAERGPVVVYRSRKLIIPICLDCLSNDESLGPLLRLTLVGLLACSVCGRRNELEEVAYGHR